LSGEVNPNCYLRDTHDCCDKLSREHLMTRRILELSDGPTAGYRWLKGQTKDLPPDALASHVLCRSHNSRLSKLDDVGISVFAAMRACTLGEPGPTHLIVNGHDFERWLVQRAAAVMYSGNADFRGFKVDLGKFAQPEVRDALVEGVWPAGGGLYLTEAPLAAKLDGTEMAPFFASHDPSIIIPRDAIGFRVTLSGIPFSVRWGGDDRLAPTVTEQFRSYRPAGVILDGPEHRLDLRFSWRPEVRPSPIVGFGPLTRDALAAIEAAAQPSVA